MLCLRNFQSTKITITGVKNIRMIQKGQIVGDGSYFYAFGNFKMLMAS